MASTDLLVQLQNPNGDWVDVGLLHPSNGKNWFESFSSYWSLPFRPVLGQVFEEHSPDWRPSAHASIPRWFSHLLPEGQLRQVIARAAGIHAASEMSLAQILGADDLPGATRFVPASGDSLSAPQGLDEEFHDKEVEPELKFSLAGLQMKFSLRRSEKGLTVPARGSAGNVILKLPDQRPTFAMVPEVEYATLTFAGLVGLDAPVVRLFDATSVPELKSYTLGLTGNSLAVDRFDRSMGDHRIHAEEFAQILHVATTDRGKYKTANFETVANTAARLVGQGATEEVIDRLIFNILVGNGDAHLKNWAFIYPDGVNPMLSPVYDVLPTVLYIDRDHLGMNLGGTKDFASLTTNSFRRLGEVAGVGDSFATNRAAATTERVLDRWDDYRSLLPREAAERLTRRLATLAIVSPRTL